MSRLTVQKYQFKNKKSPAYGKTFGRLVAQEVMTTNDLCRHIQKHGSIFTSDVVKGVIEKFINCFSELLLEGNKIKLEGLGTFYLAIKTTGEENEEDFSMQKNLKTLRIRFLADKSKESEYATAILTQRATFRFINESGSTSGSTSDSGNSGSGGSQPSTDDPDIERP